MNQILKACRENRIRLANNTHLIELEIPIQSEEKYEEGTKMISKALGHKSKLYSSFKLLAGSRTRWMVLLLWCRHSYNEDHCLSLQSLLSSPAAASCSRHDDDDQDDQDYNANDHHHLHVLPPVFPLESCSLRRFRYTSTQLNVGLT